MKMGHAYGGHNNFVPMPNMLNQGCQCLPISVPTGKKKVYRYLYPRAKALVMLYLGAQGVPMSSLAYIEVHVTQ